MEQEKREYLGRQVRNVWVEFAKEQANPKPSHLIGWDELDEDNKEVDRRIGEHIADLALQALNRDLLQEAEILLKLAPIWLDSKDKRKEWIAREADWMKKLIEVLFGRKI